MAKDLTVVVQKEVSVYEHKANALDIKNAADMTIAVTILSETNKVADRVKEEKEKITKPLMEALNVERARWKPLETAIASAVATIKGKMVEYQRAIEAANAVKEEKLMARVDRGTMSVDTAVAKLEQLPDATQAVSTEAGLVQWTTIKKLVIEDPMLIPRVYLVVDEVAVKAALKNGIVVPGAKLVEEKIPKNFR